jgi:hypothetical protein
MVQQIGFVRCNTATGATKAAVKTNSQTSEQAQTSSRGQEDAAQNKVSEEKTVARQTESTYRTIGTNATNKSGTANREITANNNTADTLRIKEAENETENPEQNNAGGSQNAQLVQMQVEEKQRERIEAKLEEKNRVNYSEIAQNGTRVLITPSSIRVGYEAFNITNRRITVVVGRKSADVVQMADSVAIDDGTQNEVLAKEAEIVDGKLMVEGQQVNILPSDIIAKTGGSMQTLELVDNEAGLQYVAKIRVNAKILGFISAPYEKEVRVNAKNGEITKEEGKPWWSFIATE